MDLGRGDIFLYSNLQKNRISKILTLGSIRCSPANLEGPSANVNWSQTSPQRFVQTKILANGIGFWCIAQLQHTTHYLPLFPVDFPSWIDPSPIFSLSFLAGSGMPSPIAARRNPRNFFIHLFIIIVGEQKNMAIQSYWCQLTVHFCNTPLRWVLP